MRYSSLNDKIESSDMKAVYQDGYMSINIEEAQSLLYYKIVGYPKFSKIIRNGHDKIYETVLRRKDIKPVISIVA
ncbi:MAG: hypothetical protein H7Y07_16210, partial [Pyrinomonadaceae bacterium]|nr:hypothetical protein [Sphingobacteriaceae bacterium]